MLNGNKLNSLSGTLRIFVIVLMYARVNVFLLRYEERDDGFVYNKPNRKFYIVAHDEPQ